MSRQLGIEIDGKMKVIQFENSTLEDADDIVSLDMGFYNDGTVRTVGNAIANTRSHWLLIRTRFFVCMECEEKRFYPDIAKHYRSSHGGTEVPNPETRLRLWKEEVIRNAVVVYREIEKAPVLKSQQDTSTSLNDRFPPIHSRLNESESGASGVPHCEEVATCGRSVNQTTFALRDIDTEEVFKDPINEGDSILEVADAGPFQDQKLTSSQSSFVYDDDEYLVSAFSDFNTEDDEDKLDDVTIGGEHDDKDEVISTSSTSSYASVLSHFQSQNDDGDGSGVKGNGDNSAVVLSGHGRAHNNDDDEDIFHIDGYRHLENNDETDEDEASKVGDNVVDVSVTSFSTVNEDEESLKEDVSNEIGKEVLQQLRLKLGVDFNKYVKNMNNMTGKSKVIALQEWLKKETDDLGNRLYSASQIENILKISTLFVYTDPNVATSKKFVATRKFSEVANFKRFFSLIRKGGKPLAKFVASALSIVVTYVKEIKRECGIGIDEVSYYLLKKYRN